MGIEQLVSQKLQAMTNQQASVVRKYLYEILKERYPRNENIIDRLAACIVTARDLQEFGKLINEIYEVGYLKAVGDYRHLLPGREVRVVADEKPQTIFKQSPDTDLKE